MKNNKKLAATVTLLLSFAVMLGIAQKSLDNAVTAANNERMVPYFEVDPFWPQPLPNKWILGSTIGVAVDARDHGAEPNTPAVSLRAPARRRVARLMHRRRSRTRVPPLAPL